jgi:hypothetical protein
MTLYSPLVLSALFGAMGALVLARLLILARKIYADLAAVARYDCADQTSGPGSLRHGCGRRVDDNKARHKQAWEHTTYQVVDDKAHTIYGPYTNDFGAPGYHKIRFRILGSGFPNTNDPVVVLDVIQAPFGTQQVYNMIGQRVVRAKELRPKYKTFSIICYPTGGGVYEYRCSVVPSNFKQEKHTLRLDEITVFRHLPGWQVL